MNARTRTIGAAVLACGIALALPRTTGAAGGSPDSVPPPPPTRISYYYDAFEQGLARPMTRACDAALLVRKLGGMRREAADLDAQDRVRLPSA